MSKINAAIEKAEAAVAALAEKYTAAKDKLTALLAERAAIEATQNVTVGQSIVIIVGRGENRREVEAVVRARKDKEGAEGVRILKVEYTGAFTPGFAGTIAFTPDAFSNEFAVIESTSIVRVVPTPETETDIDTLIAQAEAESAAQFPAVTEAVSGAQVADLNFQAQ